MNSPCLRTFASGERVFFKFKATSFKSRPAILKKLRETTNLGVQRTDKTIRYVKGNTGQLYSRVVKIRAFSNLLEMRHCICACHMVHVFVPSSLWRTSKAGTGQIKRIESQTKRNQMNGLSRNNFRIIPLLLFLRNERKLIWDLYHSTVKFRK